MGELGLSSPSPKPCPPRPNPNPKLKEVKNPKSYGTGGHTIITFIPHSSASSPLNTSACQSFLVKVYSIYLLRE